MHLSPFNRFHPFFFLPLANTWCICTIWLNAPESQCVTMPYSHQNYWMHFFFPLGGVSNYHEAFWALKCKSCGFSGWVELFTWIIRGVEYKGGQIQIFWLVSVSLLNFLRNAWRRLALGSHLNTVTLKKRHFPFVFIHFFMLIGGCLPSWWPYEGCTM